MTGGGAHFKGGDLSIRLLITRAARLEHFLGVDVGILARIYEASGRVRSSGATCCSVREELDGQLDVIYGRAQLIRTAELRGELVAVTVSESDAVRAHILFQRLSWLSIL